MRPPLCSSPFASVRVLAQVQLPRHLREHRLGDRDGLHLRQAALRHLRVGAVQIARHRQSEHRVAEELQPLVGARARLLRGLVAQRLTHQLRAGAARPRDAWPRLPRFRPGSPPRGARGRLLLFRMAGGQGVFAWLQFCGHDTRPLSPPAEASPQWRVPRVVPGDTSEGAPIIKSTPAAFLGNAITSRMLSSPQASATMRSKPKAIPPCGGAPY